MTIAISSLFPPLLSQISDEAFKEDKMKADMHILRTTLEDLPEEGRLSTPISPAYNSAAMQFASGGKKAEGGAGATAQAAAADINGNSSGSSSGSSSRKESGTESRPRSNTNPSNLTEGFGLVDENEMDKWMDQFDEVCSSEFSKIVKNTDTDLQTTQFAFLDIAPFARNAAEAICHDSFTQCFESKPRIPWNFTWYLMPLYWSGVFFRYFVLLPIRFFILLMGMSLFALTFVTAIPFGASIKSSLHAFGIRLLAQAFLLSWCAVVREHGSPPPREPGQIYVANHSSVIDVILLLQRQKFSLTGQAHPGLIGFFQNYVLAVMDNLWFDRMESKDRNLVAKKIKAHAADINKPPLLVFPEGVCVNNEYVVMFKRGAFDLGSCIVPVAIKYNKIFVDAYWNSKKMTFAEHLFSLMSSWAVVCDVWYMEPQYKQPGESSVAFAARVKEMIAAQANLKSVPWDGYLKYFQPKPEFKERRQQMYTDMLKLRFPNIFDEEDSIKSSLMGGTASSTANHNHNNLEVDPVVKEKLARRKKGKKEDKGLEVPHHHHRRTVSASE